MDDPPKTVRRTLPIGRAEERVVERGTKPDQTGPARPLVLEDRTEIRGAKRGQGGRGAGWPKKSSKSLRTAGRTKDRRRFSCPSLNHSLPLGSTRPFSTSVGPFVLASPCLCRCLSFLLSFASSSSSFSRTSARLASRSGQMPAPACDEEDTRWSRSVPERERERKTALT